MTSRLDRLFILLESGSSPVTRKAAAKQIGEVQKLHPHELHNLLNRLVTYLHSSNWDTRVAAASAVQAILTNVPEWSPTPKSEDTRVKQEQNALESTRLSFDSFDLESVLYKGARLLGSEGTEFDMIDEGNDPRDLNERLASQRAMLSEKLGLSSGVKVDELITLEDMTPKEIKIEVNLLPVQELLTSQKLSSREKNREKRKARRQLSNPGNSLATSSRRSSCSSTDEPDRKRTKLDFPSTNEATPDGTGSWGDASDWPLETFCSKLFVDLFSPKWERRHGAATALRELLRVHSKGAGKGTSMTSDEMDANHQAWLEDAALRLLCVLALDRFGDFVSDQVIAPVRETCAQVLGTVIKDMPEEKVVRTIGILMQFVQQKDWEVRHGGLLGLKYVVVVREDLIEKFIPGVLDFILIGMRDSCEDVGAVSASILIPIASHLPQFLTAQQIKSMVKQLWDLLLEQDELASACNSFMGLLAALLCNTGLSSWVQTDSLPNLVPRLWPFLSHSATSVRKATLQTLRAITLPFRSTSNGDSSCNSIESWPSELLQEALRHIYQRVLVEHVEEVQELVEKVWLNIVTHADLTALLHATCPFISSWLCLAMQPARLAFDQSQLIQAKTGTKKPLDLAPRVIPKLYLGGTESVPADVREKSVIRARFKACRMIGLLSKYIVQPAPNAIYTPEMESPLQCYTKLLMGYIGSRSALQRIVSGLVVGFWTEYDAIAPSEPRDQLQQKLKSCLTEYVYYDEVAVLFTRLLQEAKDFLATLKQHKILFPQMEACKVLTLDQILLLCTSLTDNLKAVYNLRPKVADLLEDRRRALRASHATTSTEHNALTVTTQAILAGAIVNLRALPNEKFAPYIKPLMEAIKREENETLQRLAAQNLARLIDQVVEKNPCPNNKIVTNLCAMLRCDPDFTPKIPSPMTQKLKDARVGTADPFYGIISLVPATTTPVRQNGVRGRPSVSTAVEPTAPPEELAPDEAMKKANLVQRNGAAFALETICSYFGADLSKKVPFMWDVLFSFVERLVTSDYVDSLRDEVCPEGETNSLINSLQLLEAVAPRIHSSFHDTLFGITNKLTFLVRHPLRAIRHLTARCLSTLAQVDANRVMIVVMDDVVPFLSSIESIIKRQGAAETIACIINKLQFDIVPYVVLLIVPLLGRMSDQDDQVRLISTQSFATLIQLMPLDGITPISGELNSRKMKDKEFLEYLFSPKSIPDFKMPVPIKAELRSYQQAGVNWLWFLNQYKLHGILCDDMGLGKTLQTICILAGDHFHRGAKKDTSLPSIVICPPTLTGHWVYEISKFVEEQYLRPLHYTGLPTERERLRSKIRSHNLVVASYDIVRKDIDFFSSVHWNYCVLDEGHIIKNGKTKSSKAIKVLSANHRLILSGTPIQNNVLELWSLFDFLMPGFLGTEKQFASRFSRPILASRDPKSSTKDQEAGALAMEALHRQVLPFLLRRVKEDVLTDLPPKITQDLLCELSPLQQRLYEDFSREHLNEDIRDCLENLDGAATLDKKTHIFQALRYLQNVCNHPKLVLNPSHPEYSAILSELNQGNGSLSAIEHSAKLPALKQLLLDCGIGSSDDVSVNQHRALIFCQLKAMLDIIENDLFKKHLPTVTYLRLDGSVPASSRHSIVTKFNGDPSIDVLLLTTQVGGLGLNLTGADTVIFVEHDWNPMKDLQAMDRAHRIGQKKVVNVYRLITQKSLEEKIMGLQKFKLMTANTVVSDENASMETMGTDQLLDLFSLSEEDKRKGKAGGSQGPNSAGGSVKQIIENLPELWGDQQYEEEYDLTQFIQGLKK